MNFIDWTNLGGLPFTQNRVKFLHDTYSDCFTALAKLCGDKTILSGVVVAGGVVSDGWIVVNGEILPFVGGTVAAKVVITQTAVPFTFADTVSRNVQFSRVASCAGSGGFNFSELVPLLSLQNMWLPGDMKEKIFVDGATADAYIAANFVAGYGINEQRGWAIVTTIYPDTAGKVMVPVDAADGNLDQVGKMYGAKTHTLAGNEQGAITAAQKVDDIGEGGDSAVALLKLNGVEIVRTGAGSNQASYSNNTTIPAAAAGTAHNNMQPTYAILKLVKL